MAKRGRSVKKSAGVKKAAGAKQAAGARSAAAGLEKRPLTLAQAEAACGVVSATRPARTARPQTEAAALALDARIVPKDVADLCTRFQKQADRDVAQRIRDYKATMKLLEKNGVSGAALAAPETPGRFAAEAVPQAARPVRVLAEGDSWFDYPAHFWKGGLVKRLKNLLGIPILDLSKAGDEVRNMLGVEQRTLIAKHLRDGSPAGGTWDYFLFSGGGNDIVGNPMALWINPYAANATPAQSINQPRFSAALSIVRAGYEDLIALRDTLSPSTVLVFHSYDFAIPDGRGICGMGPWLKPTFDLRGYPSTAVAFPVVKEMLRQFGAMLTNLAAAHPKIKFVDTQGTLSPVPASWHNELHPSDAGYDIVAQKLLAALG